MKEIKSAQDAKEIPTAVENCTKSYMGSSVWAMAPPLQMQVRVRVRVSPLVAKFAFTSLMPSHILKLLQERNMPAA